MSLIVMALIYGSVCFIGLNNVALIDLVDEGIYASIARQMIETGDWVTPRYGATVFFYKPPLAYWCQALSIYLFGATPLAARLPSAIAGFLTAFSLYYWARQKGALLIGWLAGTLYILSPLVAFGLARVAMMDSLLTLFLTLAVIGWIEGYGGKPKGYLLMAVGMGLATMTKGAIGFLLPSVAFLIWLLIRRDWKAMRQISWAAALGIFLLLVLPWHLAAWRAHGNWFLREYILHQHIQRFLGEDFGHKNPVWYYFPVIILSMFPWSACVPLAWWRGWRRGWQSQTQSLDCAMAMLALWAAVVFVFFSLSGSKLPNYILPALPALSLLIAWRLDSVWQVSRGLSVYETLLMSVPGILLGILLLVVGALAFQWRSQPSTASWLARRLGALFNWKEQSQSVDLLWQKLNVMLSLAPYWIALGVVLLLGSSILLVSWRSASRATGSAIVLNIALIILVLYFGLPAWTNYNAAPLNALGQRTLPALQRGEPLVMYALHPKHPSLRYLLGHNGQIVETFSPEVLQSVLINAGHGYILTTQNQTFPSFSGTLQQEDAAGRWVLWRYESGDR